MSSYAKDISYGLEITLLSILNISELVDVNWCYLETEFHLLCYNMFVFDNTAEN